MLRMPEGKKIEYHWVSDDHIQAACGDLYESGCTWEDTLEIDAPSLPDAHELNHAYAYLLAPRHPIPFLAEGFAEAIACDGQEQGAGIGADWRSLVASLSSDEVQSQGGLFVRWLIRTHGVDAFLRYYEQSPERRDPALFGANFESFWGSSMDDAWGQAHGGVYSGYDNKICPCSLPALVPGGTMVSDPARAPYWTVPADLGGQTLAVSKGHLLDCAGFARTYPGDVVLARLDSGKGWYLRGPQATASLDHFISEDCASAVSYPIEADPAAGLSFFTVMVPAASVSSPVYLAIDVSAAAKVDSSPRAICDSCAFDPATCPSVGGAVQTPVSGRFDARLTSESFFTWAGADVTFWQLRFIW
jgi:hypothetical protein